MTLSAILVVILILALLGTVPAWVHSSKWGYGPSGDIGVTLLVVVILLMTGQI